LGQATSNDDDEESSGHAETRPHSGKQNKAIFSQKPILVCATGIQWGKTTVGAVRMDMAMHRFSSPKDNFLVTAPTYKIMQQSTLPAFMERMAGSGEFHKSDHVFEMFGGGKAWFRTATDPDSIVGITNIRHVWGDEAGLYSLYFWENMQARAAFKKAPIDLTTSPYVLNWIYKELIRPKLKDENARPDVELIRARSDENPFFPKDYYDEKRKTMDPRRFEMMFGGEWNKSQGLVYDCFDEEMHVVPAIALPDGTEIVAGVDWGTTHPFVIHLRAITPDGMQYQIGEHYESGLTISSMVGIAQRLKNSLGVKRFYCDPAQPGYIKEFNMAGLTAVPADNDVRLGIDRHYALLKEGRFRMFRGMCSHSILEYETYRYPDNDDDISPNKDVKERNPVKQDDDAMDATRYVSVHTYRHRKLQPIIISDKIDEIKPKENHQKRIERLRKPKTERWEKWS
jgi:PBSX family phage terminase large subunit